LNRRSHACEVLTGTGIRIATTDGREGSAHSTPVWKTGACLSTPMPEEMEFPTGIGPVSAVQTLGEVRLKPRKSGYFSKGGR
jgi:hypothetical protein